MQAPTTARLLRFPKPDKLSGITDVLRYDEPTSRRIRGIAQTAEIRAQRGRVVELLCPVPGHRVLDVGCGPGELVLELHEALQPGGSACGVDISPEMIAMARDAGVDATLATGTTLPFDDATFDAAVSTQVYEFVADIDAALAELRRVLRPGARVVILDTDWDSLVWHSSDRSRMARVIDGWRARTADPHLPRTLRARLREAGFADPACETFTILDLDGDPTGYSAHQIEHLGTSAADVPADVVAAWAEDLRDHARGGRYFFSLNRYLFTTTAR